MSDEMLNEFPFYQDTFTGKVETHDLTDIDRAVAGFAQYVIHTLTVTDMNRVENKEFARFADRDAQSKVFFGKFPNELEFIKKLVAKFGGAEGALNKERNKLLPACYIYREDSISFAERSDHNDISHFGRLTNDQGAYASLSSSNVRLTYTLTAVTMNKPTLDRIVLGFLLWLRHTKKSRPHSFKAKTKLAGADVELDISVVARNDVIGEAGELAMEETRMVANRMSFDVIAQVIQAEEIKRTGVTIGLAEGNQIE